MVVHTNRLDLILAAVITMPLAPFAFAQAQPAARPVPAAPATTAAEPSARVGGAYPLATCPISGKKFGSMGDPVVKLYDGREVRFCCPACPPKFEKAQTANLAKIDEQIIKDQGPLYPLKTSLVTGKELPSKPFEFVFGNRLIRLGAESEKAAFMQDAATNLGALDKAVVDAQGKDYPIAKCPVSGDEFGGDMGKAVDVVLAGRLVRLCCKDCRQDLEKDPAKFITMADEARKNKGAKPDADHKDKDGHADHKHGDK